MFYRNDGTSISKAKEPTMSQQGGKQKHMDRGDGGTNTARLDASWEKMNIRRGTYGTPV